jgi:hypothetical protein
VGKLLTAEQILAADDGGYEEVPCEEWGGSVLVWTVTELEIGRFQQSLQPARKRDQPDMSLARAKLVALCVRDESGKRLFTEAQVGALARKSPRLIDLITEVAKRRNGLTGDAEAVARKNSSAPDDGSPTG